MIKNYSNNSFLNRRFTCGNVVLMNSATGHIEFIINDSISNNTNDCSVQFIFAENKDLK